VSGVKEEVRNEVIPDKFKVIFQYFCGGAEENQEET
jgi:hypothetical protein